MARSQENCESLIFDVEYDEELAKSFESAADYVASKTDDFDGDQLLIFYGLYKQAQEGPCLKNKPGIFDFKGKKKWEAWKMLGDMTKSEAMEQYIQTLKQLKPEWDLKNSENNVIKKSFGPAVSTMMNDISNELDDNQKTAFDWVKEGSWDKLYTYLTQPGFNINEQDSEGMTLLHWACDRGHTTVVKNLLQHGCDVNCQDEYGQTALHYVRIENL
ncbi:acyl-CoA-binding domain-containing protein 6-like isoform X2 [Limulus polyphemus]|uniref:Acyl-CoA-binding domain-containing protein 6 n=1 Tax=Limulus polyphemus TaxID=6850 RepID=A0ABM1TR80_LIMPO|nr:acyl-CoA-binding domain-containing protein 6-like isoform X2 [Limulus polyphemus]